tara:strand:- start:610 stop:945 length:336 start_codon:yes stop_codon:yes gene_type:complete
LENSTNTGNRYNVGKAKFSLIPPLGLKEIANVATMGAEKYDDWNWLKGLPVTTYLDSMQRHIHAFSIGQTNDEESGYPHMAHAAWNAMAIIDTMAVHPKLDDRPTYYKNII